MNRILVVYRSKTGFTKKYAEWIAQEANADLLDGSKAKIEDLLKYDTIVFGGAIYAGGINGFKIIAENFQQLKDKKLIVFTLGVSPIREETLVEIKNKNLSSEQQEHIHFFMLRGGFNYDKLNAFDKILMSMMKMILKKKKDPTADDHEMLAAYTHPIDFTDKKAIAPIIEVINT